MHYSSVFGTRTRLDFCSVFCLCRSRQLTKVLLRWMNIPLLALRERQQSSWILARNNLQRWLLRNAGDTKRTQVSCNTFEEAGTRAEGTLVLLASPFHRIHSLHWVSFAVSSCPDDMRGFTCRRGGIISLSIATAPLVISCTLIDLDIWETKIRHNLCTTSEKMLDSIPKWWWNSWCHGH